MIKKSIYIATIALIFSGCAAERGSIQLTVPHKNKLEKNTSIAKDDTIPTLVVHAKQNKIDTTENRISGGLILLIGALIFL